MEPGYIVKNHDFMNSKLHKSVVIGPIYPKSFAMVKVDQYMNCQSLPSIVEVSNWFHNQFTAGWAIIAPPSMRNRVKVNESNILLSKL